MVRVRGGGCAASKPGAQAEPFVQDLDGPSLGIGSRVRVKQSVSAPAYGWGCVKHGMVGVVTKIDSDGDLKVSFPGIVTGWNCRPSDMEVVGGRNLILQDRTEEAGGLVKATVGEYVVSGAGGRCARTVNGTYSYTRQHNGAALYTKEGGIAIIYYGGGQFGWLINDEDNTEGWYYSKEGSRGCVPCGKWTKDGYDGSDVLPCPTVARVGDDSDEGARPQVGATVLVLSASDSSTRPYVGQTGRLLEDDDSGRPFKVEFDDGNTWWFKDGELQKVGSLLQSAHRQTPWSGSVKCHGCEMFGPSSQTGPGGCAHCGLCSVCCAKAPWRALCPKAPTTLSPELPGSSTLCVGARVRVKRSVSNPTYGWGGVTHGKVGIVKRIDPDGDLKVEFPDHSGWTGKSSEMEVVTASTMEFLMCIHVSGDRGANCSGTYNLIPGQLRNGGPCYTREGDTGAIYYDGAYWKICQAGTGPAENGWNFSQSGLCTAVPLGSWDASKRKISEVAREYSSLTLEDGTLGRGWDFVTENTAPEDVKVAEPMPETTETAPLEVVEPAAKAATEEAAEAKSSSKIFGMGTSVMSAIVLAFTPRGSVWPDALEGGDDTNLDDIDDDDDDALRHTVPMGAPPEIIRVLSGLDDRLADALRAGDIKLLSVSWLRRLRRLRRQPNRRRLKRRQELEALFLASGKKSPFLSAEEAVALLRRGNRGVGALTHGWLSPGECDPDGARLDMVLGALEEHPQIEGIFWDFASLFQNLPDRDRTPDESAAFKRAIMVMADVYASDVGTTVLQSREIPPRPEAFDGALCLFGLKATKGEAAVRETLGCFGAIVAFEHTRNPPVVRFASHKAALAAKRAGPWPELCDGIDTLYNERPYDERGWCVFEDAVSHELLARLGAVPRVREALDALPSKVLVLRSGRPSEPCAAPTGELADRVERVVARIAGATFTGKGDKDTVPALYREYVTRIVGVVQPVLALAAEAAAGSQVVLALPPMPADDGFASMRVWHLDCMRAQHAYIPDALSGQQLNTLTDCVPMGVEGHDADGKPLAVRDARSLCAWLHDLRSSARTCALLTAGPAAGKTWLMSQLIMHVLGQGDGRAEDDGREPLVPVLMRAEQLQKRLAEQGAAFDAANDWVDAHLKLTCAPPHYAMLRAAMHKQRVLLLLDGLDEAGAERVRIEKHVAEVLAPKGFVILCTSRPAGLDEAGFAKFHRLTLAPLSDAQQEAFLATRLGDERASALKSYLRDKVPLDTGGDAGTKRRVTANPLMLSMVCSIAQLRVGIDMPTTTAELYEVAAGAMLKRSGVPVSDDARALLQATFFEAHADEQRIITEAHLAAAAARIGMRIGMPAAQRAADELRTLVARDGLPLVRLLEAKPLQMQAFHLSFQEYYTMRVIGEGSVQLPSFAWGVWWMNAVLMGVQAGGAAFGNAFVNAAQLPAAKAASVPAQEAWRLRVVATLVRKGLPAAWLPTALEAAKGVAREAAREAGKLAAAEALVVGMRVLAFDEIWQPAVVERVEGDTVDVKIQGWEEKEGLPRTQALVVASDGAGALLRLAAGAGDASLVEALLDVGVNPFVADERANTPLHRAAAAGHVTICAARSSQRAPTRIRRTRRVIRR
jgi:hypothetical protein